MAIVTAGFEATVTLVDSEGSSSVLRYDLVAATFAAALTATQALVTDLQAVSDGVVRSYFVGEKYSEDALVLPAGVEIEKRAIITATIAGAVPVKYANIIIPAPTQGIFVSATGPNARVVDTNDADAIQYLSNFEAGANAYVSDGESIMDSASPGNWSGHKAHRGSRRG